MNTIVQAVAWPRRQEVVRGIAWPWLAVACALLAVVASPRAWADDDGAEAEAEAEVEVAEGTEGDGGDERAGAGRGEERGGPEDRGRPRGERGSERGERGDFSSLSEEQRERVRRAMAEVWQREDVRRARQETEEANRKLREVLRKAMEEADPALSEIMPQIAPDPRRGGERGWGGEGGGAPSGRGGPWAWPPGELMVRLERAQQGRLMQAHERVMADPAVTGAREELERFEGERARERARLRESFLKAYMARVKELLPDLIQAVQEREEGEKGEKGEDSDGGAETGRPGEETGEEDDGGANGGGEAEGGER